MATVVCRHGRWVPASRSAQRDLQTSGRDEFHTGLELGVWHSALQDRGKVKAGVLGMCIPTGCPHETGWMSGLWSWAGSGLPRSLMSDRLSGEERNDCPRRVTPVFWEQVEVL